MRLLFTFFIKFMNQINIFDYISMVATVFSDLNLPWINISSITLAESG